MGPDGFWIMDFMDFESIMSIIHGFFNGFGMAYHNPYSIWIMDFLWNGYGFRILKNMDFGMDMDLVSNPSGPTAHT